MSNADDEYKYKTKKSFEKFSIEEINNYENQIKEIENQYFKFIKNAGDIYDELTKYQESFLKAMLKYKELNISQINFCKNLIKNYKELEKENKLNYEIISNIKNILNFKPINFTLDKNFSILSKVQKYFSYLSNNYNCILERSNNFINTEYKITEDEKNKILNLKKINNEKLEFYEEYNDHESGNIYYGEIIRKDDIILKHGRGILLYKNGGKYLGYFENDHMNGFGIFYGKDGRIEKGNKINDYKEGLFTLKTINNIIIKDLYVNNLKSGFCIKYYPNGDINIEEKDNNNSIGYYINYSMNGEKFEGEMKNGNKEGFGIKENYFSIYEGEFKNNNFDGLGKLYSNITKEKYIGEFKNNNYEGGKL